MAKSVRRTNVSVFLIRINELVILTGWGVTFRSGVRNLSGVNRTESSAHLGAGMSQGCSA